MKIFNWTNALIVPAVNDFKGNGFIHGLTEDSCEGIDNSNLELFRDGLSLLSKAPRDQYLQENTVQKLPGRYLYCGVLPTHFGHLLSEGCHRFWAYQQVKDVIDGVIILPDTENKMLGKAAALIQYFNIPKKMIKSIYGLTEVEELFIPEPASQLGATTYLDYSRKLKEVTNFNTLNVSNKPEKLFISRRQFKSVGRVAGFDAVAKIFEKNGFVEFLPEKFSLEEQLSHLKAAKVIVWEEGSAIHLLDILPKLRAKMLLIRRRPDYGEFDSIVKSKADEFEIYNNVDFLDIDAPPHNKMSRLCCIDSFFNFLSDHKICVDHIDMLSFLREESFDIQSQYAKNLNLKVSVR